jgi:drug/metabolite transporter (DMT)-like permease
MKISAYQFAALMLYAIIMGASQLIMAKASKQLGQNIEATSLIQALYVSYWLYISIIFYIFATGFWLLILFQVDIRLAYPIASTAVIFAAIFQSCLDKTLPPINYWIGLTMVVIGLIFINLK